MAGAVLPPVTGLATDARGRPAAENRVPGLGPPYRHGP